MCFFQQLLCTDTVKGNSLLHLQMVRRTNKETYVLPHQLLTFELQRVPDFLYGTPGTLAGSDGPCPAAQQQIAQQPPGTASLCTNSQSLGADVHRTSPSKMLG